MSEPLTVKAYCLRVAKNLGEKAIRLAMGLEIMDKALKVRSDGGHLCVPLNQKPGPVHIAEFNETFKNYDILVQDFSRHVKVHRNAYEIAGEKLPPHLLASFPRAIDFVGDIAIVEIPAELEEYKSLVGEAVLEAHKHAHTVLAKASAVSGMHRLREYEVIAGSPNTDTVHIENGCKYYLDLSKVYFSPRLSFEHSRVASQVEENETVVDMFAGIGPFSVQIARAHKDVKVYAVDVNPDAVEYLRRNIVANGVLGKVVPILGDAKEIIHSMLHGVADRVIMNLPEKAVEYLTAACEALKLQGGVIHYYEFAERQNRLEVIKKKLHEAFEQRGRRVEEFLSARTVREIAPFRWQVAVDMRVC